MAIEQRSRLATKKNALLLAVFMLLLFALFIPSGTSRAEAPARITLDASARTLDMSSAAGRVFQLTANVQSGLTNPAVTWSSSNPAVAVVASNGEVVAMGPGSAVITATLTDGGDTASCAVTVQAATVPGLSFMVKGATAGNGLYSTAVSYRQAGYGNGYMYTGVSPAPQAVWTTTSYGVLVTFPNVDWGLSEAYTFGFASSKFAYARNVAQSDVGGTIVIKGDESVPLQVQVDDSLRTGTFAFSNTVVTFQDGTGTPILTLPVATGALMEPGQAFGLQVNATDSGHAYVLFRNGAVLPAGGGTIVFPASDIAEYDFRLSAPDYPAMTLTSFAAIYSNGFNTFYHLSVPGGSGLTKLYLSKLAYYGITAYYTIPGQNVYGYSVDNTLYGNVTQNRELHLDTNLAAHFTSSSPYYFPGSWLAYNDLRILDSYGNAIDVRHQNFSDVSGTVIFTNAETSVERQVQRIAGASVAVPNTEGVYAISFDVSDSILPIQPLAGFIKVGATASSNMTAITLQAAPGSGLSGDLPNGVTVLAQKVDGEETHTAVAYGGTAIFEALPAGEWTFSTTGSIFGGYAPAVIPTSRLALTVAGDSTFLQGTLAVAPRKYDGTIGRFSIVDALWLARHQAAFGWDLNQDGLADREDIRYALEEIEPYEFVPVVPSTELQ
ncbi:Ig-like domain-containing protein [Paenibacillus cymbidii]|uniref:Ig-like domain-containing protein n=1 Tax=Paenibacillus cymbidii TaxID=1639034 RepID=UPI0010808382|nr:Ig-like domain-containing protein [Paenibacillus cymbidii]